MKILKILLIAFGAFVMFCFIGLAYIGMVAPETFVYNKNDMPRKYVNEMKDLSLLQSKERVQFMYSDGLLDIKSGLYALTDKHLILYNEDWNEPKTIIVFKDIVDFYIDYDDSFLEDSYISVETKSGIQVNFPVSSEKGRDRDFFNYLKKKVEEEN